MTTETSQAYALQKQLDQMEFKFRQVRKILGEHWLFAQRLSTDDQKVKYLTTGINLALEEMDRQ